jgi:4-hydroxythreonine-4-phosphate dehydrogenase
MSPAKAPHNRIGITLGDPAGIGPEVIAKCLASRVLQKKADFTLIGDELIFAKYFPKRPSSCNFLDLCILKQNIKPGQPNRETAQAALAYLKKSVELIQQNQIDALVTGPLSKEAISTVLNQNFQGHTEFLADAFGVKNFDMMFVSGKLRTVVVTRHIPLSQVSNALSTDKILQTIQLTQTSLKNHFKIAKPKIAVCGLNPHAGEGGKMGREEIEKITPAIQLAQKENVLVKGPFPADTIFCPKLMKNFDAIVAMYHDQGIIPVKTLAFNTLVNMTIGLPFIRTSPAHGTAFNIAGKNIADPSSMQAAIQLAVELSSR